MNWSERLGALPELAPPRDAWPAVRARLAHRRRIAGAWPMAGLAAAVVAGFALWIGTASQPGMQDELQSSWLARSQQLEQELRSLGSSGVMSGGEAALIAELEDRIAVVDLQLASGALDARASERLWRRRVDLLMELKAVRTDQLSLADANTYVL